MPASPDGWGIEVTNRNGAVIHPWGLVPFRAQSSQLVRWPLVGIIWEYVDGAGAEWRRNKPLMRVYTWTTLVWVGVFLSRGLVQRFLYEEDRTGWLAVARLAMGYPLTVGALAVSVLAVRRVRRMTALQH